MSNAVAQHIWDVKYSRTISSEDIDALSTGASAAMVIPGFFTEAQCTDAVESLTAEGFDQYENVEPPIGRIGITQFEHMSDRAGYFRKAKPATAVRERTFRPDNDPVTQVMRVVSGARTVGAVIASETDGTPYFAGVTRHMQQALLHLDWAVRDAPGWAISTIDAQLAWNVYLSMPERGGELRVHDRFWTPDAENFLEPGSYGYSRDLIRGRRSITIRPSIGDLVMFNSRNFHEVLPIAGTGTRISTSSFIGITANRPPVFWS